MEKYESINCQRNCHPQGIWGFVLLEFGRHLNAGSIRHDSRIPIAEQRQDGLLANSEEDSGVSCPGAGGGPSE